MKHASGKFVLMALCSHFNRENGSSSKLGFFKLVRMTRNDKHGFGQFQNQFKLTHQTEKKGNRAISSDCIKEE